MGSVPESRNGSYQTEIEITGRRCFSVGRACFNRNVITCNRYFYVPLAGIAARAFFVYAIAALLVLAASLAAPGRVSAEPVERREAAVKPRKTSQLKEVQGTVTWVGKGKIALVYGSDDASNSENELLLPVDTTVRFAHTQSLDSLARGDTVIVRYEEETVEGSEGVRVFRRAREIRYVKPAADEVPLPDDEKRERQRRRVDSSGILGSY